MYCLNKANIVHHWYDSTQSMGDALDDKASHGTLAAEAAIDVTAAATTYYDAPSSDCN